MVKIWEFFWQSNENNNDLPNRAFYHRGKFKLGPCWSRGMWILGMLMNIVGSLLVNFGTNGEENTDLTDTSYCLIF